MSRNLHFSYEDPRTLKKNTWNPNELTAEAEAKLRKSLEENGHVRPILVRELEDGSLEIVGGEHRNDLSIELGYDEVPVLNLGKISDTQAKKALLLDNSRYGEDEVGKLSALLEEIGTPEELATYMTYTEDDLATLMTSDIETDLGELDELDELSYIDEEDDAPAPTRDLKTHQTMKFKVDVENADMVKESIEHIIKNQGIDDSDALVKSGDALTWLVRDYRERNGLDADTDDMELEEELDDMLALEFDVE
ncbi:hypothetical protein JCM19235_1268 [Vibrio maritimus]|uniref:ParB-like N-terminal domain-containing protein n=1 Tax=Vibrio maritimus TaxID=990268 RepID=A0A090SUG5_9VIBR|nr:hypothetical protein JCM19235_1268 [Vibrio maritimus]